MACKYCGSTKHTSNEHPSNKAGLSQKVAAKMSKTAQPKGGKR